MATRPRRSIAWTLTSNRARFVALVLFLIAVFLMGGGSRGDIYSLPVLRPLSVLFIAYALSIAEEGQLRKVAVPLGLLAALAVLIAVQLIPLPPNLWASLPGRTIYADVAAAADLDQVWRPLSLAPARTLNSLFALTAPAAALLLYAVQGPGHGRLVLIAIFTLGLFSALWGLFQLTGSPSGPLYLYRITNDGLPVGLFSNRNHHAVLLCALIPVAAHLGLTAPSERERRSMVQPVALGAVLLLVSTALMTGSRAGLIAMLAGMAGAAVLVHARRRRASGQGRSLGLGLILAGAALAIALAAVVVFWFGRALALERLLQTDRIDETRTQILPILFDMTGAYFPAGAGFGAFDLVYDSSEPVQMLSDQYLNQAHNDLLQILIEGGLPAALLLLLFLFWLGRRGFRVVGELQRRYNPPASRKFAALAFIVTLGIASIFDYPLRVPSIMAVFAIFCGMLAKGGEHGNAQPSNIDPARTA